jgi:5-methylcytosine-specific restriction endonuclease McrA
MTPTKTCRQCGFTKPVDEFHIKSPGRLRSDVTPKVYRAAICQVCIVGNRCAQKERDPYRPAFAQRRRAHASRYGCSVKDLERMGWDTDRRAIEMQAQFENGFCPNCVETSDGTVKVHFFRDMSRGLAELTIDRINPDLPPVWPGNVQWLCATCNKRKQDRDPILHGQRIQAEHEFRCQEQSSLPAEFGQGSLFGAA